MKYIIPIIFFSIFNVTLYSQWMSVDNGAGGLFFQIGFKNSSTGFAISSGKLIYKTSNGGLDWKGIDIPYISNIDEMNEILVDNDTIIIPIKYNRLLKSTNCGVNWVGITPNFNARFKLLEKPTPNIIYSIVEFGIKDSVFVGKSQDGGLSWILMQKFTPPNSSINDFQMLNELEGYLINTRGVYKTSNGGMNWSIQNFDSSGATNRLLYFVDINIGFLKKDIDKLYRTTNSGLNWSYLGVFECKDFDFENATTGLMTSRGFTTNNILKTSNSGVNWNIIYSIPFNSETGLGNIESHDNSYFVAGESSGIYKSTNNGINWNGIFNQSFKVMDHSFRVDDSTIFAGGLGSGILYSTNNGNDWIRNANFESVANVSNRVITGISFNTNNTGWVATDTGLFKSIDSGLNWSFNNLFGNFYCKGVFFVDKNYGFVIGYKGQSKGTKSDIFKTSNGGITFEYISSINNSSVKEIQFFNKNNGFIVCDNLFDSNNIFKTTNGGLDWTETSIGGLYCIKIIDNNVSFAGGGTFNNRIYKTTDNGQSWSVVFQRGYSWLDIDFFNESTGYAINDHDSTMYFTTNGGIEWRYMNIGSQIELFNLNFNNKGTGFVFGSNNKIYKTSNFGGIVGIEPISQNVPDQSELFQNYPNPFNSSTIIKFSIDKTQFVNLKIFNIQGKLIQNFVNESLKSGVYEINFNSQNLPSGIYFYQMKTDNSIFSKKMILIK